MPIGKKWPWRSKRKRYVDPMDRKEWYDVLAPSSAFLNNMVGETIVNRTHLQKLAVDGLKNRVFEVNLADLSGDEDLSYRKIRFRTKETIGRTCLTEFDGMDFTSDKHKTLIKKWHSMIEAFVDVRTRDGYLLRMFAIGFTKKVSPKRKTCYALSSQIKRIRSRMVAVMKREAASVELKDLVKKLLPNVLGKQLEAECQGIYPLQNVFIRKVKVLQSPPHNSFKLLELHGLVSSEEIAKEEVGCSLERISA